MISTPAALGPFATRGAVERLRFGNGAVEHLAEDARAHGCARVALVIDPAVMRTGLAERLAGLFSRAGIAVVACHPGPAQEPEVDDVAGCAEVLGRAAPDYVAAIGGGSTMDTAKVARLMLANSGDAVSLAGFDRRLASHASRFACVPTTAGTASEVSEMAVVGMPGSDVKLRYRPAGLAPHLALLDPELTVSLPPAATAATGFDAFTHALEAYVSLAASPLTDLLTLDALRRLARYLPIAFREPADLIARGECLYASTLAGIAFNSTQLGLCHAIAAPLGALHKVTHGVANALVLPAVVAFGAAAMVAKADRLAEILEAPDAATGVARLRATLALDLGLDAFVPDAAARRIVAEGALKSGNIQTTPRRPTLADVMGILEQSRHPAMAFA